ncbi:hypothetical protein L1987_01405 [Smallanthus sonchifolius]|uniref:Uncharacterized protein n=1 Tax=Smallanthus sonchifolius TaxID=185202 RepID=A0ACB9K4Y5_9ASTR|nr:hypothetical protein L1987_01405 [Smallanthus sonchifolius]
MAEVVSSLEYVLTLQETTNNLSQTAGKTIFGRMLDKFSITDKGQNLGMEFGSLMPKKPHTGMNIGPLMPKKRKELMLRENEVLVEATEEQLAAASYLACRCLHLKGVDRPSMKEVTVELERIRKFSVPPSGSQDNYNEMSILMTGSEQVDLYDIPLGTNYSETFSM